MDNSLPTYNDDSGINSLRGFAYQIRVFIYYLSQMDKDQQIEFETLEDVVIKNNYDSEKIDSTSSSFCSYFKTSKETKVVQVKRTKINTKTKDKLLFNWLILQSRNPSISKYILYTEDEYSNSSEIFYNSPKDLYKKVIASNSKANALISQVKEIYGDNLEAFITDYKKIQMKFKFISDKNIDKKILEGFSSHFSGTSDTFYLLRLKELLNYITGEILLAVHHRKAFICSFDTMMKKVEDIRSRIREDQYEPDFSSFKKFQNINLSSEEVLNSREYTQLLSCKLNEQRIEQHLLYLQYYEDIRFLFLENLKISTVENIEQTTYDNFLSVVEDLQSEDRDTPIKRLNETKKLSNSNVTKEQTRFGSCIYLTKEDIEDNKKISWVD
ncbi:hypothetical protein QUF84_03865 [Fictibacillus enclensis]|uniref:hypothetical protein n=1 Tax=Fictibacillus enclensis TaxID=1017270 RepID=UPI0025A02979|nr:hypothetical protein [Fictibacillus enclensis]MDM5336369.1 hypothetical protein [Fictibacillus enclensis]